MSRRNFTNEEKKKALELAEKIGVEAAARQLGIASTSVWNWVNKERLKTNGFFDITLEQRRKLVALWQKKEIITAETGFELITRDDVWRVKYGE